jgi:allantoicase
MNDGVLPVEELSSALMGSLVISCSGGQRDLSCSNLLLPGRGLDANDGWGPACGHNCRNRIQYAIIKLGVASTHIKSVVVDTKDFEYYATRVRVYVLGPEEWNGEEKGNSKDTEEPMEEDSRWMELTRDWQDCKGDRENVFGPEQLWKFTMTGHITHIKLNTIRGYGLKRFSVFGQRRVSD